MNRRRANAHGGRDGPDGRRDGRRRDGRTGGRGPRTSLDDPARAVAFDLLRAVSERGAYANLTLPGMIREEGLGARDAALATELAYGTLRGTGTYDAIVEACVDRPLEDIDPPIRDVLRLGAHQILATRIPPHAAVATSVDLARARIGAGPAKFVNAVLRRISAADLSRWVERLAPAASTDPIERLALEHAHPVWIADALNDALWSGHAAGGAAGATGAESAGTHADGEPASARREIHDELAAALAADNDPPSVTLVARPGRSSVTELVDAGATATAYSPYGAVLGKGDPSDVRAVREHRAGVQDEGSQLVALALAAAGLEGRDAEWLDMCAGPGGKAALLAGLATERGARLTAMEISPHRARLVEQALSGDQGGHRVVAGDARYDVPDAGSYDRVLLDAPCTGLGALRRRPEARWRRTPEDVPALVALQSELLVSALEAVRPGGLVAYVTCSPHVAETRSIVDGVTHDRRDVELLDARPNLPGVPGLGPGPWVQLWPHRHGTDAMFLALLRRR